MLLIYVVLVLLAIPLLIFCFLTRWRSPLLTYGKFAMGLGRKILGIRVKIKGLEHIDRKIPYIFMANHLSFLDGPLLFWAIPRPVRVILKKGIFRIPLVGLGMKHVGFVPVDRKGIRKGRQAIQKAARLIKEKGYSFLIFPEGTRSRDGRLQEFRRGGFFLATESRVPIVPVTVDGTFELMPKGSFFARKGTVQVDFHPPVKVKKFDRSSLSDLIHRVRESILLSKA